MHLMASHRCFLHPNAFFGNDPRLFPFKRLETGSKFTPLFIHGADDKIVPVEGSRNFVKRLLDKNHAAKVVLKTKLGEHGVSILPGMNHAWLTMGLGLVTDAWGVGTE